MAFDVFISYSSKDKTAADAACAMLENAGVRCWIAPRDIRPGVEYGTAIVDAIDHCRAMILVFSSSANESHQIHREIERAVSKGVSILPVRIEEVAPTKSMEYFLGAIHWLDALNPPLEHHLQQLAETVKVMLRFDADANSQIVDHTQKAVATDHSREQSRHSKPAAALSALARKTVWPNWLLPATCSVALIVLLVGGFWFYQRNRASPQNTTSTTQTRQTAPTTLRAAAQARDFLIGTSAHLVPLRNDAVYGQTLAQEYNIIAPQVETRFGAVHPSRTEFNFDAPDAIVDFAAAHGAKLRGQPLVWEGEIPDWLTKGNFSATDISAILKEYIQTMVRHYRGRFYSWDVAWGMFDNLGKMREFFWEKAIGSDYIEQVLVWAREADPQVKLFINSNYQFDPLGGISDATYELLRKLRIRGSPIDGIAIQSPMLLDRLPRLQDVVTNMNRLAALGLELHVVEFEVSVPVPPTDQDLQRQAMAYHDHLAACLSIATCKAFLTYEFNDKYAYAPSRWPGRGVGAATPFDAVFKPKPAYAAMLDALNNVKSAAR
jgi:endo-1,4-beta-xylanase